jgi:hypothetical protein
VKTKKDLQQEMKELRAELKELNTTQARRKKNINNKITELKDELSKIKPETKKITTPTSKEKPSQRIINQAHKRIVKRRPDLSELSPEFRRLKNKEIKTIIEEKQFGLSGKANKKDVKRHKTLYPTKPEQSEKYRYVVKLMFIIGITKAGTKWLDNPEYVTIISEKKLTDHQVRIRAMSFFVDDVSEGKYKANLFKLDSITITGKYHYKKWVEYG